MLAQPPRKRKTIDGKASGSQDATFQHQTGLESDSDKLVSSTPDSAVHVLFYSQCQLHILQIMARYWLSFKTFSPAEEEWKGFLASFLRAEHKKQLPSWACPVGFLFPLVPTKNYWLDQYFLKKIPTSGWFKMQISGTHQRPSDSDLLGSTQESAF